jgi:hypothetical protein
MDKNGQDSVTEKTKKKTLFLKTLCSSIALLFAAEIKAAELVTKIFSSCVA